MLNIFHNIHGGHCIFFVKQILAWFQFYISIWETVLSATIQLQLTDFIAEMVGGKLHTNTWRVEYLFRKAIVFTSLMTLIEFPVYNDKYVTRTPIKQLIHHYKSGVNTCHITYETTITHFTAHGSRIRIGHSFECVGK